MAALLFQAAYLSALAAPVAAALVLVRRWRSEGGLPGWGRGALYLGCAAWVPILGARAAIHPAWHGWEGAPLFLGAALGMAWGWKSVPRPGAASLLGEFFFCAFVGLLAMVALSGGYFDRTVQVPHARRSLERARVRPDDPAELARALGHEDVYVRWGAILALQGLREGAKPTLGPLLATATRDADERVRRAAWAAVLGMGPAAKPAALAELASLYRAERDEVAKRALEDARSRLGIDFAEWQKALAAP